MEIIDNFKLATHRDPIFNPWLERMLMRVKRLSDRDYVIRLTADRTHPEIRYQLYNSTGKTYVGLYRNKGKVNMRFFKRSLPDPEYGFKPGLATSLEKDVELDEEGLFTAAALIQKHLDQDTPYARGTVKRIRVTPTASVIEPWTFCGGRVTAMANTPEHAVLEVDYGRQIFRIPHEKIIGHRPGVMKYIVFNEDNDFAFISSSEFEIYFEAVDADALAH